MHALSRIRFWFQDRTWRRSLRRRLRRLDVPSIASNIPRGAAPGDETATEQAIRAIAADVVEQRRQRVEAAVKPQWDDLAACKMPEHERNFGSILKDFEGNIEDIHASARARLIEAEQQRVAAEDELHRFVNAAQCRRLETYSADASKLTWSAAAIVLMEGLAGAAAFGEASRGGLIESFVIGGVIGGANVLCGLMCGWGWQAGWRRVWVKSASAGATSSLAIGVTLAAAHYRQALTEGAADPFARGLETLLAGPFTPLGSLPLMMFAVFGAFAFLHIVRTWLSIYGRVPGYRSRALALVGAQRRLRVAGEAGSAAIDAKSLEAEGQVAARLAKAQKARVSSGVSARSIVAWVSRFYGEKEHIRDDGNQKLAEYADIASHSSAAAWPARSIPDQFGAPLAVEDPRPLASEIDEMAGALEKTRAGIVMAIHRLAAAGKNYITAMVGAIRDGIDIGPDFPPPALTGP
jgi:hypothetical protein